MLRGQPTAQHIIRVRHDLHTEPVNVGVQLARVEVNPLPRLKTNVVQQQRAKDARVGRVAVGQLDQMVGNHRELRLTAVTVGPSPLHNGSDQRFALVRGKSNPRRDQAAQPFRGKNPGDQHTIAL